MDCRTAQFLLPFRGRPGELGDDERTELEQHVTTCKNCAAVAEAERAFDERVGQAMQDVVVPGDLREQILGRLTVERGNLWRKQILRASTAVAAGLLILFLGFGWWANHKVELSADMLSQREDEYRISLPADEFFRTHDLKVKPPPDFDPGLLVNFDIVEFDGQRAARLDYQRGDARAKVYVLSKLHFKIKKGSSPQATGSSGSVEIDEAGDLIYVIVYVGDANRQQFLNRNQQVG